jgi:hypothetical protein
MSAVPLLVTTRQKLRVVKTDFLPDCGWADFVESHPEGLTYPPPGMVVGPPERISPALPGHDVCGRPRKMYWVCPLFSTHEVSPSGSVEMTVCRLSSRPWIPICGLLAKDRFRTPSIRRRGILAIRLRPLLRPIFCRAPARARRSRVYNVAFLYFSPSPYSWASARWRRLQETCLFLTRPAHRTSEWRL